MPGQFFPTEFNYFVLSANQLTVAALNRHAAEIIKMSGEACVYVKQKENFYIVKN